MSMTVKAKRKAIFWTLLLATLGAADEQKCLYLGKQDTKKT